MSANETNDHVDLVIKYCRSSKLTSLDPHQSISSSIGGGPIGADVRHESGPGSALGEISTIDVENEKTEKQYSEEQSYGGHSAIVVESQCVSVLSAGDVNNNHMDGESEVSPNGSPKSSAKIQSQNGKRQREGHSDLASGPLHNKVNPTKSIIQTKKRKFTKVEIDNDQDSDIDRNDDFNDTDKTDSCEGYRHNCNRDNGSETNIASVSEHENFIGGNLNRWRQQSKSTNFLRLRVRHNKSRQQEMQRQDHTSDEISTVSDRVATETLASNSEISFATDVHIEQQSLKRPEKNNFAQGPSCSIINQCSELSGSIIGRSLAILKKVLSKQKSADSVEDNKSHSSDSITDIIQLEERSSTDGQQSSEMPTGGIGDSGGGRYLELRGDDDHRRRRKSSESRAKRDSRRSLMSPDEFSRLNHHPLHRAHPKESQFCQDLQRFILLVVIISICCVSLWKLYGVLIEEYDFLGTVDSPSILGKFNQYAVSTDALPCAKIGKSLLAKGGSAVDAAIGTLLCMGVVIPNSLGLGGGCLMTIYSGKDKIATVIDGREVAPGYATEDMFANNSISASRGPLSLGVPGELAAYWKAHQMFGKLNWSELFDDTISMAEKGLPVVEHLAYSLRANSHAKYITPELAKLYTSPETGEYLDTGEILVQKNLSNTLRRIRDHGAQEFYGGLTGQMFIADLQKQGGKMTMEDLLKYEALIRTPLEFNLSSNLNLYTQPVPGSGVVLSIILRIMKEFGYLDNVKPQASLDASSLYYHRLVESFKFAYAQRAGLEDSPDDPDRMESLMKKLLSEKFIKEAVSKIDSNRTHSNDYYGGLEYFQEDHGTAHVSVLDSEGNAAAITSSVNLYFGSGLVSSSTGIVYNDVMDDFVSPNLVNKFALAPSKFNHIRPGKRPISSMAPSVFTDAAGNVRLVIGGSGGAKITTAIASVSLRNVFLGEDIKTAIDGPRLHHQFLPNKVWYELNFPKDLLQSLTSRNHSIQPITDRSSVIMAIAAGYQKQGDKIVSKQITANSDYRKGGTVDGN